MININEIKTGKDLQQCSNEELISLVLLLKKLCEDSSLKERIAVDSFRAYRTSINQSLSKIQEELNNQCSEYLTKLTGKKR